jgi:hypothetical protein
MTKHHLLITAFFAVGAAVILEAIKRRTRGPSLRWMLVRRDQSERWGHYPTFVEALDAARIAGPDWRVARVYGND